MRARRNLLLLHQLYNPTTREQYTDSFLLSFYLSESYSRRARWLSLATEKDNFSCARHKTGCGEDYRRGLIQSFFVLFSFSARRQNSRVPKIFFEKKCEFFSRHNIPSAGISTAKREKRGARRKETERERIE